VGPSGAGKSTLLSLLLRFYDVTDGRITLDGQDLRNVTQQSLRNQMSIVFQNTFLFDTSILHNIRLTRPDATFREIEAAARAAEIHDRIMALPEGYDTRMGEDGVRLAGGERQRIAIARALLRNPAILLLDEVTASLDAKTAAAINATIERLTQDRIVIAVTHDIQAATRAHRIVVLDAGNIVEDGTHHELFLRKGLYYTLWRREFSEEHFW
jgi:ATP-binding cassette subfamily B protein